MKPFQVLCIKKPSSNYRTGEQVETSIEAMSEYTVIGIHEEDDQTWYQIAGAEPTDGFDSRLFATLPGLTADEMKELERESILM